MKLVSIKIIFFAGIICLAHYSSAQQNSAVPSSGTIRRAVKKCEADVANNCVDSGTCAKFCEAAYARSKSGKSRCLKECTVEKRCKAKGPGKQTGSLVIAGNRELDTWTADQLAQCIAEERDPENKKTGRRNIPWKQIVTPSLAKLLGVPAKIN